MLKSRNPKHSEKPSSSIFMERSRPIYPDRRKFTFWRTSGGHEVDFVIGDDTAVEVKGSENISERYCKPLEELLVNAVCPAR